MDAYEHCWHDDPAETEHHRKQVETCCFCGDSRSVYTYTKPANGHGPYVPMNSNPVVHRTFSGGVGPCHRYDFVRPWQQTSEPEPTSILG